MRRYRGLPFAGLGVAALFAWLTFRRVDWSAVHSALAGLPGWAFAAALLLKATALGCMALRSRVLLRPLHRFGIWTLYRSLLLAFVGNNLLPLRAGEVLRIGYLARTAGAPAAACLSAIALERMLDVLCLLVLCVVVLPELLELLPPGVSLVGLGLLVLLAAAAVRAVSRRPEVWLARLARLVRPLPQRPAQLLLARAAELVRGLSGLATTRSVLASLVWTFAFWLTMSAGIGVWLVAFDLPGPSSAPLVVLVFVSLQAVLPVPGQIGTYHYFAAAAVGAMGADTGQAVSFALVLHFMSFVPFTLIGVAVVAGDWVRSAGVQDAREGIP